MDRAEFEAFKEEHTRNVRALITDIIEERQAGTEMILETAVTSYMAPVFRELEKTVKENDHGENHQS